MKKKSNSRPQKRVAKWAAALIVIGALAWYFAKPKPVEVDAGKILRGPMQVTVDDDGETRVRERYVISAPLAGRLLRVKLDPGDPVELGDVLVTLDPLAPDLLDPRTRAQAEAIVSAAELAVDRAKRELDISKANLDRAEKSYQRYLKLSETNSVAEAEIEEAERAVFAARHGNAASEASVLIAEFELEQARAAFLRTGDPGEREDSGAGDDWNFVIHAPVDGVVLRLYEESSQVVPMGAPLLEVGDPGDLEMVVDVLSQDAVKIRPGQRVIVRHWGGEKPLEGFVRRVEPSGYTKVSALGVDEQRVDVIIDLETRPEGDEWLGDGFRIEAGIVTWEDEGVLQVPAGALFRDGSEWCIFVIEQNRAVMRSLQLGQNNGDVAEVLSGIGEGAEVILHPGDRISEGARVKIRN